MTIASMTGFARTNGQLVVNDETISWVWEAKSVNGKGLELKFRLPAGYDELTAVLKNEAAKYLVRGSVGFNLEVNSANGCKKAVVDEDFLKVLMQKAINLVEESGGKIAYPSAAELLNIKGVVEIEQEILSDDAQKELYQKIVADFIRLCENLKTGRLSEGRKMGEALGVLLDKIEEIAFFIEKKAEGLPEVLQEKLHEQLDKFARDVEVDDSRIAQEVVLLVTRADIREEIDRLKAHISAARDLLTKDEAVGRRLDFLCQELNREANTVCSKSSDIEITNSAMELKVLIEQFREQVQNIE